MNKTNIEAVRNLINKTHQHIQTDISYLRILQTDSSFFGKDNSITFAIMMQKITITVFCLLFFGNVLLSQRTWSLEKCIQHVEQNNITSLRRANLEIEKNKAIQERAEAQKQPDLGFGTNLGLNLGRAVDPATNEFKNQTTLYNNFSLESNYTLYDGGRMQKRIDQSQIDVKAAQAEADQMSKDISLEVLQAYLQILMIEEQLTNAKKNLSQTEAWYRQTQNLVNAGSRSRSDLREVEIQKARDEQIIIDRENLLARSYTVLKLILEIDPSLSLKVEKPKKIAAPDKKIENLSFKSIYSKSLKSQPGVEGGELRLQSLKMGEKLASLGKQPTVSLFGGVYTNYSSAILDFDNPDFTNSFIVETEGEVIFEPISTDPQPITYRSLDGITFPRQGYFRQLGDNLGLGIGANVYVPIFDKKQSKLNAEIARINYLQVQEDNLQFKQQLRTDIQNAIADVQAAAKKLKAVEKTFSLLEAQIVSMKNKFNLGNINAFEYKTIINERDRAEIELVIAKYDFLLKKMVVEFYEGKRLKLN